MSRCVETSSSSSESDSEDYDEAGTLSKICRIVDEPLKITGSRRLAPRRYQLRAPKTGPIQPNRFYKNPNVLNLMDMSKGRTSKTTALPVGEWIARVDLPHGGQDVRGHVPHVNINRTPDPHLRISPAALSASEGLAKTARVMQKVNKVAVPVAIALDTARLGCSLYKDCERNDERTDGKVKFKRTARTAGSVAGGWGGGIGGGYAGAQTGALIGSLGGPIGAAIGGIVGGIIGSVGGGIGGSVGGEKMVQAFQSSDSEEEDE